MIDMIRKIDGIIL